MRLAAGVIALTAFALISTSFAGTTTEPKTRSQAEGKAMLDSGDKVMANVAAKEFLFNEKEWSVDLFGVYAFEAKSGRYNDGFGPGIGVNYFFNRYFGVGLDAYGWEGNGLMGAATGNLLLRYPIEQWHLAPYLIGGIGASYEEEISEEQLIGNAGVGVEYRLNRHWGVFTDGRYVLTDKTNDYAVARVGVRYAF